MPIHQKDLIVIHFGKKIANIRSHYLNIDENQQIHSSINNLQLNKNLNVSTNSINSLIRNFSSKIYNFKNMPEPKNATEGKLILIDLL